MCSASHCHRVTRQSPTSKQQLPQLLVTLRVDESLSPPVMLTLRLWKIYTRNKKYKKHRQIDVHMASYNIRYMTVHVCESGSSSQCLKHKLMYSIESGMIRAWKFCRLNQLPMVFLRIPSRILKATEILCWVGFESFVISFTSLMSQHRMKSDH
jgi:hypothetical protein